MWTPIFITQKYIEANYIFEIYINGSRKYSAINMEATVKHNVDVQSVKDTSSNKIVAIKNLVITTNPTGKKEKEKQ